MSCFFRTLFRGTATPGCAGLAIVLKRPVFTRELQNRRARSGCATKTFPNSRFRFALAND
jgi:hypothetical protein